jgi:hypothetical protein
VSLPNVTIKANTVAKFTPVVGSGGVGQLTYTISPSFQRNVPNTESAFGWIEAFTGRTDQALFHYTGPYALDLRVGDTINAAGFAEGSVLQFPTGVTRQLWTIAPGRSSNYGSPNDNLVVDNGLHINANTGEITGRCLNAQGPTTYTVTVSGGGVTATGQFTLTVSNSIAFSRTYEVPYGSDPIQKCDIYQPSSGTPKGVVIWVHGGGWTGGAKSYSSFTSSFAGWWINDEDQITQLARKGYVVINCNYRLATADANYIPTGGSTWNYHPAGANDIETIIRCCTTAGAGSAYSSLWNTISSLANTYGLVISGESAGGHLVAFAGMKYINDMVKDQLPQFVL